MVSILISFQQLINTNCYKNVSFKDYFLLMPVLRGMCYPVCGVVYIKDHLLLIGKSDHVVVVAGFLSCYLNNPYKSK